MPKTPPEQSKQTNQPKRRAKAKANTPRACASCRKSKTRCEILGVVEDNATIECHRCSTLGLQCSYTELAPDALRSFAEAYRSFQANTNRVPSVAGPSEPSHSPLYADTDTDDSPNEVLFVDSAVEPEFFKFDHMWTFVRDHDTYDWSTPLSALDTLSKRTYLKNINQAMPQSLIRASSLDDILNESQRKHLISLFQTRYLPWLNISLIKEKPNDQILDLVCCTIASRDLDRTTRSKVAPSLRKLTTDTVTQMIFNPNLALSLESVQALLILSLWAPITGDSNDIGEGTILITTAINMAAQLHLDTASAAVDASRTSGKQIDPRVLNEARLWAVLTNVDSLLCFGSGRSTTSVRSASDKELFPLPRVTPETLQACRDIRLKLHTKLFTAMEESLSARLTSPDNMEEWHDAVSDSLTALERCRRLSEPLKLICRHEKHFHETFPMLIDAALLAVSYQALYDTRVAFTSSVAVNPLWFLDVKPRGVSVAMAWGGLALRSAESLLMCFLQADPSLLVASPDHIFTIITFAVGFCVGIQFLVKRKIQREFPGWTFQLIDQTVDQLRRVAVSQDHPAARCAYIVNGMAKAWKNRANPGPGVNKVPLPRESVLNSLTAKMTINPPPPPSVSQQSLHMPTVSMSQHDIQTFESSNIQTFETDDNLRMEDLESPDGQNLFYMDDSWTGPEALASQNTDFWSNFFSQAPPGSTLW